MKGSAPPSPAHGGDQAIPSQGVRAGSHFQFLGAQTPVDPVTGRLVRRFGDLPGDTARKLCTGNLMIDAPAEVALVQTWQILANVGALLERQGLSLRSLVHQRFFLRDIGDLAAVQQVVTAALEGGPPSTTIVAANGPGLDADIALHADFVAFGPGCPAVRQDVGISQLDSLTAPFPLASRAGQYVFTSPLGGIDVVSGEPVTSFDQLAAADRMLADGPYTRRGEMLAAQQLQVFRHIDEVLRSQGSSLAWQVRQNGWMRVPMREFGPASAVRRRLFSGPNTGPFTSVTVSGLRDERALFEYGVIALVPPVGPDEHQRSLPATSHQIASYYVSGVRCGPYVVTAGEVPVDAGIPGPIESFLDLGDDMARWALGRIDTSQKVMAQACFVYARLRESLKEHGASMADVVHQTIYLIDSSEYAAVERVAVLFFGPQLPPTTPVPILSTSPYPSSRLEIELVALTKT